MTPARRVRVAVASLLVAVALVSPAASASEGRVSAGSVLRISISMERFSARLGNSFGFQTTITNTGTRTIPGVVEHLNIASLEPGVYVDPEDWSTDRTRYPGSLRPGQSLSTSWQVKPVNAGHFAVYVGAFPTREGSAEPAASPILRVQVAEHRTLNPGGVLPLAVGIPVLLGVVALTLRRRRRR